MLRTKIVLKLGLAVALALSLGARSASAAGTNYTLSTPNASISSYSPPFGSVNVTVDATGKIATFTFTAGPNPNGTHDYLFVDSNAANVNVTGGAFGSGGNLSAAFVSASNSFQVSGGFAAPSFSSFSLDTNGAVDGFGRFNLQLNLNGASGEPATSIVFTVTRTTGTWASDGSDVLTNTGTQVSHFVAAHIAVFTDPATNSAGALATGFATEGPVVPEPSSMAIAGLGALGFAAYGLRRRLKK